MMAERRIVFQGKKGNIVLTEWEVRDIIRWYENELRRMQRPGTRYTAQHRADYQRTVDDYNRRLRELDTR